MVSDLTWLFVIVNDIYKKAELLQRQILRLFYAGKTPEELTHEEAIACAKHFYKAHVETTTHNAKLIRRMEKMELALTKDQLQQLDWWLSVHPQDTPKGDGSPRYPDWTMFELTVHGYQIKKRA